MTVETVNGSLQRPGRSKTRLALAAVCFFLALLCKETALTLPAVLLVYDLALERNERSLVERAAEYTPCLLAAAVYLMVRYRVLWATLVPATRLWNLSSYELAINVLPLFSQYARMLIVPIGLKFWHSFQPISSLLTVTGICSVVTVSAFLCAAVLAWMKHRLSFLCLALFVLPLCPALFISALPMKPLAERYLYLPSAGFVILAALALSRLSTVKGMRIVALAAAVALTSVYSAATIRRNRVWQSAYTLFADTVKQAPDAQIPRYDLAIALANQGRVDEAMEHYRILVGANPNYAAAQSAYGSALLLKGRLDEAIEHLTTALSLDPSSLESYNDLAIALRKKGEVQEAIAQYRKALAIDPEYADAHFNLASALADTGHIHEAMEHYRAAVRLKPENAYYRNVIGIEYGKQGLLDEAIEQFREAVRLAPSEPAYTRNLERARALKRSGQPPSEIAK
jgi:tetratricopeptide (TPR) repeat protein